MYNDYVNLLRKICHRFKGQGIDFDELMSIANEHYARALRNHDISREEKFSTLLYNYVKNGIMNELKKERMRHRTHVGNFDWDFGSTAHDPERRVCFVDHLKSLSDETQEVLAIVLNSPTDLLKELGSITTPKNFRGELRRKLLKENWPHRKIWRTFKELKEALK